MDVSLNIPAAPAASMEESMSEERIPAMMLPRRTAMPVSSPNKIMPLGFHSESPQSHPDPSFAKRVTFPLIKKVVAELLGTFLLVFMVLSALIMNEAHGGTLGLLGVASTAGLAMVVLVSSLGHVSGGHMNPSVSIAMAVFRHLPLAHLAPYLAAQVLGATCASFAAKAMYRDLVSNLASTVTTVPAIGATEAFFIEFMTTFAFLFVVTALATDPNAVNQLVAVGVGAAVMMSALISAKSTGASMNPARSLGTAIATGTYTKIWVYMVAPPLGAIAGSGAYTALK
ncbi:hypothetical protein PR202_ga30736 [Eleusine coracana subsp. coracana]|uniref:Uncharacterized protein n=1 Tax=Eleusine coracana subsp. coracana TaxID=191504 RepID=A0AAV5DQ58_ELECO|nr:hypothetical protein QOZ80_8AG0617230 [Eleusine coracana subsp. coracana]GJN12457.1 hypothetical protein PR202_ga30736 [Eleusine coracana subsp. coracana]